MVMDMKPLQLGLGTEDRAILSQAADAICWEIPPRSTLTQAVLRSTPDARPARRMKKQADVAATWTELFQHRRRVHPNDTTPLEDPDGNVTRSILANGRRQH